MNKKPWRYQIHLGIEKMVLDGKEIKEIGN